jgi:osmotically-inducible protein OsmY
MRNARLVPALLILATLGACDRGRDDTTAEASTYTKNGPQASTAADPANAPSTPRATLAPASPQRDTLTDTVITGKIKAAILTDPGMTGADISVNTDRGVVALAGSVKSQEQIAIASAHAQRQDGVLRVDNHLAMNAQ